jgi:hypothetical protein
MKLLLSPHAFSGDLLPRHYIQGGMPPMDLYMATQYRMLNRTVAVLGLLTFTPTAILFKNLRVCVEEAMTNVPRPSHNEKFAVTICDCKQTWRIEIPTILEREQHHLRDNIPKVTPSVEIGLFQSIKTDFSSKYSCNPLGFFCIFVTLF